MNENFSSVMYFLTMSNQDIYSAIKPRHEAQLYFDRDSEDEGTTIPEIALLKLFIDMDSAHGVDVQDNEIQALLNEMRWVMSVALDLGNVGAIICLLNTDASYDLFWNVIRRYAKDICRLQGIEASPELFDFEKLLLKYGHTVE